MRAVRVTCHGNEWALELNDDKPIFPWQAHEWGKAVGVPEGVEWRHTAQLMVARCEWRDLAHYAPAAVSNVPPRTLAGERPQTAAGAVGEQGQRKDKGL